MTRLLFLGLLLLNFALPAFAQTANEKAEALLHREMRERRIPGLQAAVVKNGKIVLLTRGLRSANRNTCQGRQRLRHLLMHESLYGCYVTRLDGQKLSEEKLVHDYAEFPEFRRTASQELQTLARTGSTKHERRSAAKETRPDI